MPEYTFDEEKHKHFVDGEEYKSCTDVLDIIAKPALIQWAADLASATATNVLDDYEKMQLITDKDEKTKAKKEFDKAHPDYHKARLAHRKKKDKAADWGTLVHKAIEIWIKTKETPESVIIKGTPYPIETDHRKAIDQFIKWAIDNRVEFLISEKGIYSLDWKVGGIVDFVCKIDGKLYIGDLKTSSSIYETYFLQVAAYGKMMMEMGLYDHFDRMIIINCKKNGEFDVKERKDVAGNIKCYEAARILSNRLTEEY